MAAPLFWVGLSLFPCVLLFSYLPLVVFASPVLTEGYNNAGLKATCSLKMAYFDPSLYIKKHIIALSEKAKESDLDTDNKLFGKHLFFNVDENYQCHLMKQVLDFMVEEVLQPNSESNYPSILEVTNFLQGLQEELRGCELEEPFCVQHNLAELKKKVTKLGESAQNKAIGELRLLLQCLKDACSRNPEAIFVGKTRI